MDWKKRIKVIKRFFARVAIHICSLIVRFTPRAIMYGFAAVVAKLGYLIAGKQRKIAFNSLTTAFGKEKNPEQIRKIAKDCFAFMAKSAIEMVYMVERPALVKDRARFTGIEHLKEALDKGKGAILVSAHFGNFPLLMAKISLEGYPISGIIRYMRDEKADKILNEKRRRLGIKTIYSQPRKTCVENSIKVLRNNELLFIPLDQNFGTGGIFVDFFGKKAATATGPVILALRTKAVILPCFIIRNPDDTHKIIFEKEFQLEEASTQQQTIMVNIQRLTGIIESYIRKYPAEWGWIHRRWKSQQS